jgi:hypothetical protein
MTRMSAVISCQFLVFSQGTKNRAMALLEVGQSSVVFSSRVGKSETCDGHLTDRATYRESSTVAGPTKDEETMYAEDSQGELGYLVHTTRS